MKSIIEDRHNVFPLVTVHIIGLGLIGGSLARAIRSTGIAKYIAAYDIDVKTLRSALQDGMIDWARQSAAEEVESADLIIFACPPDEFQAIFSGILPRLRPNTVMADTLSVKQPVLDLVEKSGLQRFVPTHPIAGGEYPGYAASIPSLFAKRRVILTPPDNIAEDALRIVERFWTALGAVPERMSADMHDRIYALVSHLPHILAYGAAETMSNYEYTSEWSQFLRLAASPAKLWQSIALANRVHILASLQTYLAVLDHLIHELAQGPEESQANLGLSTTALFPRIAASCLISAVALAERQGSVPVARYAGAGFADFISPAETPPEKDIEAISEHFASLIAPLRYYADYLKEVGAILEKADGVALERMFATSRERFMNAWANG